MNNENTKLTADNLLKKIKHFLITNLGQVEKEASIQEFYTAFCFALREEIMINWITTEKSFENSKTKVLYYLSMEYLPGKFFANNITNLKANEILKEVLKKSNRELSDLLECDPEPGLGNGGLGRLASCFLDSLATQQYPAIGYGLRYQYGIFSQEIWEGKQIERPDCWLLNHFPWEFKKDFHAATLYYKGSLIPATNSHGDEIFQLEDYEEVRALPHDIPIIGYSHESDFSILTLRLWSTKESPNNFELQRYNAGELGEAGENNSLTDVLYPNDNNEVGKRIRLKQEFLLASASLQDIFKRFEKICDNINLFPEKVEIQINDTHPAFLIAELMRKLTKDYDLPWAKAWELTKNSCNYTNHTTLKEALEEWNEQRVETFLPRQYKIIQKINQMLCDEVKQKFPNNEEKLKNLSFFENGQIKMSHLAIYGSKKINGVSQIHEEILKTKLFKDFYEIYPEKFLNIPNGVTPRKWLLHCNPTLSNFITERIGKEWITDFKKLEKLHDFADDKASQEEFIKVKRDNKKKLIKFFSSENPIRNYKGKIVGHFPCLSEDSLFDVHIKRFHEYKRQLLNALHLLILYHELKNDINSRKIKRMVIVGGKAAPGYKIAKQTILLFFCIARKIHLDEKVSQKLRLALIENYNVTKAETVIPAADLSEQISTAGLEASGTGNMKLSLNGALTLGSIDGANIEMKNSITEKWWPFSFGKTAEEIKESRETYKSWQIYTKNPQIKKALDTLKDGSLVKTEEEHKALTNLYERLLVPKETIADYYFVLGDLESYYQTQKKVEDLFIDQNLWAKYAIHNIASMGHFSSDYVIENYAEKIWNLKKCPLDKNILNMVKKEYFDII